jgi:hypothetical protein
LAKARTGRPVAAKEAVIVLGRETGITNRVLAEALALGASAVSKQVEAARARGAESSDLVASKVGQIEGSAFLEWQESEVLTPPCAVDFNEAEAIDV